MNMDFEKHNDEYTEGYLSDKEHFNGVLFLLREPHTDGEIQKEFWFKKSLINNSHQRSFSLYKNKFNIFLKYLNGNYNLSDCAYANIRPDNGERTRSEDYNKMKDEQLFDRFEAIVKICDNKIKYVFTCYDIFDAIKNYGKGTLCDTEGITYKKSNKNKRVMKLGDIIVYEIYHPSYTKYPKEPDYD